MKNAKNGLLKTISILCQSMLLMMLMSACEKSGDPVSIAKSNANDQLEKRLFVTQCPSGQHWDRNSNTCVPDATACPGGYVYDDIQKKCVPQGNNVCAPIDDNNATTRERNRAVNSNGNDGGYLYDQIGASNGTNYSSQVSNYLTRIKNAIDQAGTEYANSFGSCDNCQASYNSSDLLNKITNYVNPIKNDVTNDGSLTSNERGGLLTAIQAIYDNFDEVGSMVENRGGCFPDPPGYSTQSIGQSIMIGGMVTQGFFSGLVKAIKKVILIVVTVVSSVVDFALLGAVGGFLLTGGDPAGFYIGGFIGGIYGLYKGIRRAANGQYTSCFVGLCA